MKPYEIHKTVKAFALKKKISIRRESNGHYYLLRDDSPNGMSIHPTAKSGVVLIKRYLRRLK